MQIISKENNICNDQNLKKKMTKSSVMLWNVVCRSQEYIINSRLCINDHFFYNRGLVQHCGGFHIDINSLNLISLNYFIVSFITHFFVYFTIIICSLYTFFWSVKYITAGWRPQKKVQNDIVLIQFSLNNIILFLTFAEWHYLLVLNFFRNTPTSYYTLIYGKQL